METTSKLHTAIVLFAATLLLFSPITAIAAPLQEVCLAEESVGASRTEQHFVIVDASGAVTEYVYNYKGLLVKETNPLGEVTSYEYDVLDRLSKTITPDGTVTKYSYDITGNVAKVSAQKVSGEVEELQYAYTQEGYLTYRIETMPSGLNIIQTGRSGHYEIVPASPMSRDVYQSYLDEITVSGPY